MLRTEHVGHHCQLSCCCWWSPLGSHWDHTHPAASCFFTYHFGNQHQEPMIFLHSCSTLVVLTFLCLELQWGVLLSSYPHQMMKSLRARTFYEHLPIRCASRVLSIWKMLIKQLAKQRTLIRETFKALYVSVHTSRKIIWFETTTYLPYVKTNIIHFTNIYWVFTMTSHCSRHWGDSNLKTSLKSN